MKAAGYNAIRNAHNPASKATLDAADELGMLVIDEAFDSWNKSKKAQDYSRFFETDWKDDLASLVISGRNHPERRHVEHRQRNPRNRHSIWASKRQRSSSRPCTRSIRHARLRRQSTTVSR